MEIFLWLLFPSFMLQYILSTQKKRRWAILLPVICLFIGVYLFFVLFPYMSTFPYALLLGLLCAAPMLLQIGIYFVARKITGLPL